MGYQYSLTNYPIRMIQVLISKDLPRCSKQCVVSRSRAKLAASPTCRALLPGQPTQVDLEDAPFSQAFPDDRSVCSLVFFTSVCRAAAPTSFFRSSVHVVVRDRSFLTLILKCYHFLLCCFSDWYVTGTISYLTFLLSSSCLPT